MALFKPTSSDDTLNEPEVEFLSMLRYADFSEWHRENIPNADVIYEKLHLHGYLRKPSMKELIAKCYRVADLKPILAANSIKTSKMRKDDMVEAVMKQLPRSALEEVLRGCKKFHIVTDKGKQRLDKYFDDIAAEKRARFDEVADLIRNREFQKLSKYDKVGLHMEATEPLPGIRIGVSSLPGDVTIEYSYRIDIPYITDLFESSCNELPVDAKTRDRLASLICAEYITGFAAFGVFAEYCGSIPEFAFPNDIKNYIHDFTDGDDDDDDVYGAFDQLFDEAELYIRTCLFRLNNKHKLISYKNSPYINSVEIFVINDERTCKSCAKMEGKRYELHKAPVLPFHWGCRCFYMPVHDNELK